MEKLKMQSVDLTHENIEKIAKLFPNVVTEAKDENGNLKKAFDFDLLKQELSNEIIESEKERYQLTWPGKKEAIVTANTPINKTLRPVKEDSVDWDKTQNIYIEGDNLEVLKILQENYLNTIKCIYIDPPYNTGKDFLYKDNFSQDKDEYLEESGQRDEKWNRLFQNNESNGRFHSDWLTMIYSRLKLARNLLREDGAIFISVDDNEVHNLRKICDEIFGEGNFIAQIIVKSNPRGSQSSEFIGILHEYILLYAKESLYTEIVGHELTQKMIDEYKYENDEGQKYRLLGLRQRGGFWKRSDRPLLYYPFYINPKDGSISLSQSNNNVIEIFPMQPTTGEEGTWRWGKEKAKEDLKLLIAKKIKRNGNDDWDIFQLDFLNSNNDEVKRTKAKTIWDEKEINYQNGTTEVKFLFSGKQYFDFPKPVALLKNIIKMLKINEKEIVLDFFSGSATTAHAVMQLNTEDGGNRNFIMVQLSEKCSEDSEAYKAGYKNICEIGKERIRRAAKKIKEETKVDTDYGFRVFKVDSSNLKDVYYTPEHLKQSELELFESNIKEDRTHEDLLIQVMLDFGLELSLPMETRKISGKNVHFVAGNSLVACFEEKLAEDIIKTIAKEKPLRAVFKDSSFKSDDSRINVEEIFKMLSPGTEIKVI